MFAPFFVLAGLALVAPVQDSCPWCHDDPALLAAAGLVGHGPMEMGAPRADGRPGSVAIVEELPAAQWLFLESAHLRFASALGAEPVTARDKDRVLAELERLRKVLPDVPAKARKLDPWLRLHLLVMRGEELYARYQALLGVKDADFPARRQADGPYMGDGPFLGERDKFEVLIHPSRRSHQKFTVGLCGVTVTDSLRHHDRQAHKLIISIPAEDSDIAHDRGLFPHIAHNLSHTFFCAYKHFSYDPPVWLDEGLAHMIEKEIEPESTTMDGEEGALPDFKGPSDWHAHTAKLVAAGKAPSFATLMHAKTFDELDMDAQITGWSRVRFLSSEHPAAFAALLGGIKGQLDAAGYPSGADLPGLQRALFAEHFGWTPAEFDTAWSAWVTEQE
jgi:hypothetical protein